MGVCFFLACLTQQGQTEEAVTLLKAVASKLKDHPYLTLRFKRTRPGGAEPEPLTAYYRKPKAFRLEVTRGDRGSLTVSDGKTVWLYNKKAKWYMKLDTPPLKTHMVRGGPLAAMCAGGDPKEILKDSHHVEVKKEELDGEPSTLIHIKRYTRSAEQFFIWIDGKRSMRRYVRQWLSEDKTYRMTWDYVSIKTDPLDDALFSFTPPADAKEFKRPGR